jgi:hypothetical protein
MLQVFLLLSLSQVNRGSTTVNGPVTVQPSAYGQTAFGQTRVAQPYTQDDIINLYEIDPDVWSTSLDGGATATHLGAEPVIALVAPRDAGISMLRSESQYRYQAGKGERILQTLYVPSAPHLAGQMTAWGYFDDNDGLFWRYDSAGLSFITRSSTDGGVLESSIPVDAGVGWNPAMGNIYELAFQWLGVGTVSGFINGAPVFSTAHANTQPRPYMAAAFLPLSYTAQSSSAAASTQLNVVCATVQSEGGAPPGYRAFSATRPTEITTSVTNRPVISIRPAAVYLGKPNRIQVWPVSVDCYVDTTGRGRFDVILNPGTLTGASFASTSPPSATSSGSGVEVDVSATAYTGGVLLRSVYIPANTARTVELRDIFGDGLRVLRRRPFLVSPGTGLNVALDTLSVTYTTLGGTPNVACNVGWFELR